MALTGSGTISMGDMRTEFGISGAISMSDLYRGDSEVPSSATTTVGASVPNLTGSAVTSGGSGFFFTANAARFTSNMTCGSNGNITANGNIVFTSSASGDGDNGDNISISGGLRIVSTNATTNAGGTITGGTTYKSFTGSTTTQALHSATLTTTISNTTALDIPSGTTAFKILTYAAVSKRPTGQDEGFASVGLNNPTSGAFTSTSTSDVNTGVPTSSTIAFSDLYGATA